MRLLPCITFLLILGTLLSSCGTDNDTQEAEVYRAYINTNLPKDPNTQHPYDRVVISDMTSGFENPERLQNAIKKLSRSLHPETIKDLFTKNGKYWGGFSMSGFRNGLIGRRSLNSNLRFNIKHELISDAARDHIFGQGGWKMFYQQYPNCRGIVDLSRVGFDKNKAQALLYVGNQWDYLAGEGFLVFLENKDGEWKIVDRAVIWVS